MGDGEGRWRCRGRGRVRGWHFIAAGRLWVELGISSLRYRKTKMFFDAASMRGAGVLNKVSTCVICVPFRVPSSAASPPATSSSIASSSTASSASAWLLSAEVCIAFIAYFHKFALFICQVLFAVSRRDCPSVLPSLSAYLCHSDRLLPVISCISCLLPLPAWNCLLRLPPCPPACLPRLVRSRSFRFSLLNFNLFFENLFNARMHVFFCRFLLSLWRSGALT